MTALIVDSFAGGGGASTGIEIALGRSPDVAINHNADALALHAANHPATLHLDSNIWDVAPRQVTGGRPVGLLWASPDCKHFSKAKGGAPKDRNIRDLAWVIVRWMREAKPDVVIMENVEEFRTWGPVDEQGQPIAAFAGQTFADWTRQIRALGYRLQWRELRACDHGAPTIRKRFFMIARRDGRPIVWPKPTHGDPKSQAVRRGRLLPWRTAAEIIDWSLPCPSIFDDAAAIMATHGLRAVRPLAGNTLARIARGLKRFVLDAADPFLIVVNTSGHAATGPGDPVATVTTGQQHALIAPSITRFNGGATGQDVRDPMATVTANSWIDRPGGAPPFGVVAPVLTYAQHGGASRGPQDPLHTVTASRKDQNALIAPTIMRHFGTSTGHAIDASLGTVTAGGGGKSALIAPTLVQTGYGEAPGQAPRALDPHQPLGTVVAGGVKHAVGAAFIAQHNTGVTARAADDPLSTITATGGHQQPVAAWMAKYYGTGDGAPSTEPMHTVTVKDRMGHMQAALAAPPFGPEHHARARQVADFLRAHGAWDGGEVVTLTAAGATFVIVDIGMRMLTPRELFRAQGFPDGYIIDGAWTDGPVWRAFPKHVQISCCGNSVCPPIAAALVKANCGHLAAGTGEAAA